jgi:hypothetical protein
VSAGRRLLPFLALALGCAIAAPPPLDGPPKRPPDPVDEPDQLVSCEPECPAGAFCSTRELCASEGPIACAQPCKPGYSCGPFAPGCQPDGCAPEPWPVDVQKAISLTFALPEDGCDLDGDGRIDNALGAVARILPVVQDRLRETVETARSVVMLRPREGLVDVWFGAIAAASVRCNAALAGAYCLYTASPWSFDTAGPRANCDSWWTIGGASTADGTWRAGTEAPAEALVPLDATALLLRLELPRLTAREVADADGTRLVDGMLCAALVPAQLRLAIAGLPAPVLEGIGGLERAEWFFDQLVHADLDLDGDGDPDHVSAAVQFETTPARVIGLSPQ